jgi:hypothetical protein
LQRECNVTASTNKKSAPILPISMNQNNQKNKTEDFEKEMDFFYVPVGAILVELDGSENPNYTIVQYTSALLESEG